VDFHLKGGVLAHAVLRVDDTGISETEVPVIFDRFHRVAGAAGCWAVARFPGAY
jgi:signal transduction histidine kinase